jgi:hypothetical protein
MKWPRRSATPARHGGMVSGCGAGGWVMVSQDRRVNFSRTVCTTCHCRGMDSRLSVIVSPQLGELAPTARTRTRRGNNHPFARQMLGQWRAHRFAPGEGLHHHAIVCCAAGILGSPASNSSSSSSIWSSSLRPRSDDAPRRSCLSLAISNLRWSCTQNLLAVVATLAASTSHLWSPRPLRVPPVDPLQHVAELHRRDSNQTIARDGQMNRPRSSRLA